MRWRVKPLIFFWLNYVVIVSSAQKNVVMTITCKRYDVRKTQRERRMTEKKVRLGGERERENWKTVFYKDCNLGLVKSLSNK